MTVRTRELDAFLARCAAVRWLEPDAEMAQQSASAVRWMEEQADVLRAFVAGSGADASIAVRVVRSRTELVQRFRAGLLDAAQGPVRAAFQSAAKALGSRAGRRTAEGGEVFEALESALRASPSWRSSPLAFRPPIFVEVWVSESKSPPRPRVHEASSGLSTCQMCAEWAAGFGGAGPAPWEPMFAFFERGAWPVLLGGELLVWVPLRENDVIVDDARAVPLRSNEVAPSTLDGWLAASEPDARTIRQLDAYRCLEQYMAAGLAPPPCSFIIEGEPIDSPEVAAFYPCLSVMRPEWKLRDEEERLQIERLRTFNAVKAPEGEPGDGDD